MATYTGATKAEATEAARKAAKYFTASSKSYIKDKSITNVSGGNSRFLLRWKCALEHIDHFNVDWEYYDTKTKAWQQGNGGIKEVPTSSKASGYYQDEFQSPSSETVTKVRARVRAVAEDRTVTLKYTATTTAKTETYTFKYWVVSRSTWARFDFSTGGKRPDAPEPPDVEAVVSAESGVVQGVKVSWGGFEAPTTCILVFRFEDGRCEDPAAARRVAPTDGHGPAAVFQNPDGASWIDRDVENGHVYRYALRAHNKDADEDPGYAYSIPFDEMDADARLGGGSEFLACLSEPVQSWPLPVKDLTASMHSIGADGKASVLLQWSDPGYAGDSYRIRYTAGSWNDLTYEGAHSSVDYDGPFQGGGARRSFVVSGLDAGETYLFVVDVVNEYDVRWHAGARYAACLTGAAPEPPTPYATEPSYVAGDEATLSWEHNAADGSAQVAAEVQIDYSGARTGSETVAVGADGAAVLDLAGVPDGTTVTWKVRTRGVHPDWSGWSESVSFAVYAPPSCYVELYESADGGRRLYDGGELAALPLVCALTAGGAGSQTPVEWSFELVAAEDFAFTADDGSFSMMRAGSVVARALVTATDDGFSETRQVVEVPASAGVFANGASYEARASVLMDTGLRSAEASVPFSCGFDYDMPDPVADAWFNGADYTMAVLAGCYGEGGELLDGVTISVYRVGPDGAAVPIAVDVPNSGSLVTDPHPCFGECSYRVVATDRETDQHSAFDTQPVPVPVYGILVQWDEDRVAAVDPDAGELAFAAEQAFLPYDVAVEETAEPDRELVEVIGREDPIAFYGTQLRIGGTWSASLHKRGDSRLIGQLRKLQRHPGTCYVRETSGAGYRAVADVRFSRSYDSDKVPVTLELTKVDYSEVGE